MKCFKKCILRASRTANKYVKFSVLCNIVGSIYNITESLAKNLKQCFPCQKWKKLLKHSAKQALFLPPVNL